MTPNVVAKTITVKRDLTATFRLWTEQTALWWPAATHSMSGDPQTVVQMESFVGGRFFERASDGREFEWGTVLVWEPPHRLSHTWYMGTGAERPTRVDISFTLLDETTTRIDIEHRGPELIGERWKVVSKIFPGAWDAVLHDFPGRIEIND